MGFEDLFRSELARLGAAHCSFHVERASPAGEPFVGDLSDDLVGLALSGGGIRSATFNLGLPEGLHEQNILSIGRPPTSHHKASETVRHQRLSTL